MFLHMLTGRAAVFADVRTYWSPDSVKRVTGWTPDGKAEKGFIHLINSGAAALDGTGAGIQIFNPEYGATILVLPFGGFLTLGVLIAVMQYALKKSAKKKQLAEEAAAAEKKEEDE